MITPGAGRKPAPGESEFASQVIADSDGDCGRSLKSPGL